MNQTAFSNNVNQTELFGVLEKQATLDAVREMLKSKGLVYSAPSWSAMLETRVEPALLSGAISADDVIAIIRESEEHGNKHVHLFSWDANSASTLLKALSQPQIEAWVKKHHHPELGKYTFAAYPQHPKVVEVRIGDGNDPDCFILKIARTEHRRTRAVLQDAGDGQGQVYVAERIPYRAVDVLKVRSDGLIEARIAPRSEPPVNYVGSARALLRFAADLFDPTLMTEYSLAAAKNSFSDLSKHKPGASEFHLYEMQHKNERGDRLQSSSLADQGGMTGSSVMHDVIKQFTVEDQGAYCEKVRVAFQFNEVTRINTILSDELNEIIFTAALSRQEYDAVLAAVLKANSVS